MDIAIACNEETRVPGDVFGVVSNYEKWVFSSGCEIPLYSR